VNHEERCLHVVNHEQWKLKDLSPVYVILLMANGVYWLYTC
jgi:hypothetical protein